MINIQAQMNPIPPTADIVMHVERIVSYSLLPDERKNELSWQKKDNPTKSIVCSHFGMPASHPALYKMKSFFLYPAKQINKIAKKYTINNLKV